MSLTVEQKKRIRKIKEDYYKYCETNLYIQDKRGMLVKLKPNRIQRKIIDHVLKCLELDLPIRIIVLKARQEGVSTIVESLIYWYTATNKNVTSKIVSHDRESATNLYSMFARYYENSEKFFKPSTKYRTKNDLLFDNDFHTGLKSSISISSAENTGTGRGLTVHWLHASEVAMWSNGAQILAGLIQTVPMLPRTAIFLESTANGVGDFFYDTWQAAKEGRSAFTPLFFGWHEHDEYQIKGARPKDLTEEEKELKEKYGVTGPQIAWRREKIKEFAGNEDLFAQEYPINETEAFLAAGRPRFDVHKLMQMEKDCRAGTEYEIINEELIKVPGAPLRIWEKPQAGVKYVIGADVSDIGDDYSVATVMRVDKSQTVARFRGQLEPSDFGDDLFELGKLYNMALIGVESNNHGLTTVQRLRDKRYMNMYRREKGIDERFEEYTSKLGWRTDRKTKPLMINHLAEQIAKDNIRDPDITFIRECITYVIDDRGRTNAQIGKHDDTVMATAIALQLFESGVIVYRRSKPSSAPSKYLQAKRNKRRLVK
jgi:hypothetical protein